jgi:iron complex outermembrane receptor protein
MNYRIILTIAVLGYSLQLSPTAMSAQMEEIIVTARATEESVREIPVAISVVNEDRMNAFGIESFSDLEALTPQLTVARGGSGNAPQSAFAASLLRPQVSVLSLRFLSS